MMPSAKSAEDIKCGRRSQRRQTLVRGSLT